MLMVVVAEVVGRRDEEAGSTAKEGEKEGKGRRNLLLLLVLRYGRMKGFASYADADLLQEEGDEDDVVELVEVDEVVVVVEEDYFEADYGYKQYCWQ